MSAKRTIALTDASPAQTFTEPLSLEAAKKYCRITDASPADAVEDEMIEGFIAAARETAEIHQNRDLVRKQWDLRLDYFDSDRVRLRYPLVTVDEVNYKDSDGNTTTLVENTDYLVDTAQAIITPPYNGSWPSFTAWPTSAILVRFTSGHAATDPWWLDAGHRVLVGMKMLVEAWYDERLPFVAGGAMELPFGISALLDYGARPRLF